MEKRKAYVFWFVVAAVMELGWAVLGDAPYRPSLVGLAIMITAVIFFVYSWLTER